MYASGELVGGTEPDGTVPKKHYTKAHLDRLYQMLLGEKPFDSEETAMQFDFNSDGKVNAADATLLRRMLLEDKKT